MHSLAAPIRTRTLEGLDLRGMDLRDTDLTRLHSRDIWWDDLAIGLCTLPVSLLYVLALALIFPLTLPKWRRFKGSGFAGLGLFLHQACLPFELLFMAFVPAMRRLRPLCLNRADLRGARLDGQRFRRVYLISSDLRDAVLAGADLSGAFMAGAMLDSADLRGARLSNALAETCSFAGANLDGAELDGAILADADLRWASAERASFRGAIINRWTRWPAGVDPEALGAVRGWDLPDELMAEGWSSRLREETA